MVMRLAFLAVCLSLTAPAGGDGLLDQVQNEVTVIVQQARGAVVAIEGDPTEPVVSSGERRDTAQAQMEAGKRELEQRAARLRAALNQPANRAPDRRAGLLREIAALDQRAREVGERIQANAKDAAVAMPGDMPKSGSGFCIGEGLIVTTSDVLQGVRRPIVQTDDGTRVRARVVGVDYSINVGLLQLTAKVGLPALKIADSDAVLPGHFAISVGNQSGQINTVSLAMVSSVSRQGTLTGGHYYPRLIQISGTVGAGTSGAPLLNSRGEVIGMVAAIPVGEWTESVTPMPSPTEPSAEAGATAGPSSAPGGGPTRVTARTIVRTLRPPVTSAGYAIAGNDVRRIVDELKTKGSEFAHGWIGVLVDQDADEVDEGGVLRSNITVRVQGIFPESPAYRAGIQPGDVMVGMNGRPVKSVLDFVDIASRLRPGDKGLMEVRRTSGTQTIEFNIETRPKQVPPPVMIPIKNSGK